MPNDRTALLEARQRVVAASSLLSKAMLGLDDIDLDAALVGSLRLLSAAERHLDLAVELDQPAA